MTCRDAGVDPDKHLDLQSLGWDKCTQAMDEAIASDKAEPIFQQAADKFQEVAATGRQAVTCSKCLCNSALCNPACDLVSERGLLTTFSEGAAARTQASETESRG